MILPVKMENTWLTGKSTATLFYYTILRVPLSSSLVVGTPVLIQASLSCVLPLAAYNRRRTSEKFLLVKNVPTCKDVKTYFT